MSESEAASRGPPTVTTFLPTPAHSQCSQDGRSFIS